MHEKINLNPKNSQIFHFSCCGGRLWTVLVSVSRSAFGLHVRPEEHPTHRSRKDEVPS